MQSMAHSTSTQNSTNRRSPSPSSPQSDPHSPTDVFRCRPHLGTQPPQNEEITTLPSAWVVSAAEVLQQMRENQTRDGFRFDATLKRKTPDEPIDVKIQRHNRLTPLEVLLNSDCFLEHEEMRPLLLQGLLPKGLALAENEWAHFCSTATANSAQLAHLQFAERTIFLAKSAKEGVQQLQICCAATAQNCSENQDLETFVASCREPLKAFTSFMQHQIAQLRQNLSQPASGSGLTRDWNTPTPAFDFAAKKGSDATFVFEKLLLSFVRGLLITPPNELDQKLSIAKSIVVLKTCQDVAKKYTWLKNEPSNHSDSKGPAR